MKLIREMETGRPTEAIRTQAVKTDQAYQNLTTALDGYRQLVEQEGIVAAPGQARDAVVQARRNIQLQLKELYNLGVLNGPDLALMDQMLPDPTLSITAPFNSAGNLWSNPAGRIGPAVDRLKELLRGIRNSHARAIGLPPIPPPPQATQGAPQQQGAQPPQQPAPPEGTRRTLNGMNYILRNGQWFQE
jgi:hypothetical protein